MKTRVFFDTFKNHKLFAIWEIDEDGNKIGQYPILSMGYKKAQALLSYIEDLKTYVDAAKSDEERKSGGKR